MPNQQQDLFLINEHLYFYFLKQECYFLIFSMPLNTLHPNCQSIFNRALVEHSSRTVCNVQCRFIVSKQNLHRESFFYPFLKLPKSNKPFLINIFLLIFSLVVPKPNFTSLQLYFLLNFSQKSSERSRILTLLPSLSLSLSLSLYVDHSLIH